MTREALCRIDVTGPDGRVFSAELFAGALVKLYRVGVRGHRTDVGEGRFANGEIMGMPGGSLIDERVYAAIEGAIEAWQQAAAR